MRNLTLAVRSLFKKGRHNVMKIFSLGIGLAVALTLIAKVYFEQSYDAFYPHADRIYRLTENIKMPGKNAFDYMTIPGGVAPGMRDEVPGVEAATRLTELFEDETSQVSTSDKRRYSINGIYLADSCIFDVLPRPVLSGDPKEVLSRPGYAMICRSLAERMGGIDKVDGMVIVPDDAPNMILSVGGVFEDIPENAHLRYEMLVSLASYSQWSQNNWLWNDRYSAFVRLAPGIDPESLRPAIHAMQVKHIDPEAMRKSGVELTYFMKPIRDVHGADSKNMIVMLTIVAFALLCTAVMNYILIAISSMVSRLKEIAMIKSYGASGKDILGMTIWETGLHMVVSLGLAVLLIFAGQDLIMDLLDVSARTLLLSQGALVLLGICVLVLLVTGVVPGTLFARISVVSAFSSYRKSKRIWKLGLLFFQFAAVGLLVSLLIVIGRQHRYMVNSDPGYAYDRLAYCAIPSTDSATHVRIINEIGAIPDVEKVSTCELLPFDEAGGNNISLPNMDQDCFNVADPESTGNGFLSLMEIPVIEGRSFTEDVSASGEVMVSRSFVEEMKKFADWPDGPIGKQILIYGHRQQDYTICGVFENYRLGSLVDLDMRPSVLFYNSTPSRFLLVKLRRVTAESMERVKLKLRELLPDKEPQLTLYSSEMINLYRGSRKFRDQVMIGGIITLIISLIGLIGYTNEEINHRRKELAIRKVNGATVREILRIFLSDILRISLPAVVLGCGISYVVAKYWQRQFAEKIPLSPLLFIAGALCVCLIVVACVVYRTWKVANENPVKSLKSE